jgi:hypothetical protein
VKRAATPVLAVKSNVARFWEFGGKNRSAAAIAICYPINQEDSEIS